MMRSDLPPLPERMKKLPVDVRGFPVPWFVDWRDGEPIFQAADPTKWARSVRHKLCWLCGKTLGVHCAFVIGPMCGINRVTSEPPSHRECAEYALKACPFLTKPMARRTTHKIEHLGVKPPAGIMLERNSGVSLLWMTKSWKPFRVDNGYLINVGEPTECGFFREGRQATRDETLHSIATGMPFLQDMAEKDGPVAMRALSRRVEVFNRILNASFSGRA